MWVIPNTSQFYRFVQDTEGSTSDCPKGWADFFAVLLWRSKRSPLRTWLQRLKRVNWLLKLCTRTLRPSRQNDFLDALTSSLRDTRASRSAQPASVRVKTIPDTFGRILQESCRQLSLFGASSRTSPDTLPLDSRQFTEAYEIWVTQLRRDCLQRQKSVRHIKENGCSFWPTVTMGDVRRSQSYKRGNPQLHALVENWPTPNIPNRGKELDKSRRPRAGGIDLQSTVGLPAPDSPNTNGKSRGLWSTPEAEHQKGYHNQKDGTSIKKLGTQAGKGKLNPAWVEQLMGLPSAWTDLGSWATELFPDRQN